MVDPRVPSHIAAFPSATGMETFKSTRTLHLHKSGQTVLPPAGGVKQQRPWVVTEFGSRKDEKLPARKAGGLYKIKSQQLGLSCRASPLKCFLGRRGRVCHQT